MDENPQDWKDKIMGNKKIYIPFNNTNYNFDFLKTEYYKYDKDEIDINLFLEYQRYIKWNKLINEMKNIYNGTGMKGLKKGRTFKHGIGNVMSMWVCTNLMKEHVLVDPFIPYNNNNDIAFQTLKNGLCKDQLLDKYKTNNPKNKRIIKKIEDKFKTFNLKDKCNKIVEELIQYKKDIHNGNKDIDTFISNFNYIDDTVGYFYFKNGINELKIICNSKLKKKMKKKYDKNCRDVKDDKYTINMNKRIACVMLRYKALMGDSHQFAMKHSFKDALKKMYKVNFELFASSINSYYDLYCSLFYDIEQFFGSKGSFFHIKLNKGFYIANPPYEINLLNEMVKKFKNAIEESNSKENSDRLIISYGLPNWPPGPMGVLEALEISNKMVLDNEGKYFKIIMADRQVKWINELNGDEQRINSHCRFLIQNKNGKIVYSNFNKLVDKFWINDNELDFEEFNIKIENNVLEPFEQLENWMTIKRQNKYGNPGVAWGAPT